VVDAFDAIVEGGVDNLDEGGGVDCEGEDINGGRSGDGFLGSSCSRNAKMLSRMPFLSILETSANTSGLMMSYDTTRSKS
jgi:hypothetical protein